MVFTARLLGIHDHLLRLCSESGKNTDTTKARIRAIERRVFASDLCAGEGFWKPINRAFVRILLPAFLEQQKKIHLKSLINKIKETAQKKIFGLEAAAAIHNEVSMEENFLGIYNKGDIAVLSMNREDQLNQMLTDANRRFFSLSWRGIIRSAITNLKNAIDNNFPSERNRSPMVTDIFAVYKKMVIKGVNPSYQEVTRKTRRPKELLLENIFEKMMEPHNKKRLQEHLERFQKSGGPKEEEQGLRREPAITPTKGEAHFSQLEEYVHVDIFGQKVKEKQLEALEKICRDKNISDKNKEFLMSSFCHHAFALVAGNYGLGEILMRDPSFQTPQLTSKILRCDVVVKQDDQYKGQIKVEHQYRIDISFRHANNIFYSMGEIDLFVTYRRNEKDKMVFTLDREAPRPQPRRNNSDVKTSL